MDMRWLQVFTDMVELGTLRAVATATGYSTSAVSQHLARLQEELGHQLVEPIGRNLVLTPAGTSFLPHARAMLREYETGRGLLSGNSPVQGTVRVAGYMTALSAHVAPAARSLRSLHPAIEVHMEEREPEEVRDLLARALIDIGVTYDYSLRPGAGLRDPYATAPLLLAVHPGDVRSGDEIIADPETIWIGNSRSPDDDKIIRHITRSEGVDARIVHHIDSIELISQFVAHGAGVALVAADTPRSPEVRYLDINSQAGLRRSYTVTRPGREDWQPLSVVTHAIRHAAAEAKTSPLPPTARPASNR